MGPAANSGGCKLPSINSLDLHGPHQAPLMDVKYGFNPLARPLDTYNTRMHNPIPPIDRLSPGLVPQFYGAKVNYLPSTTNNSIHSINENSISRMGHISPVTSPLRSGSTSSDGISTLLAATAKDEPMDRSISDATDSDSSSTAIMTNEQTSSTAKNRPRKKRQCPECKLHFSNLATHKSTHLKPTSRPHICKYCNRGFARPNDLFRHTRCHWKEIGSNKGQFKCPFKNNTSEDNCCHSSGIFSRCDTFKNHLKAIHFQYPSGTKKDQRNKVSGDCRVCHKHFNTVDEWLTQHVEKNECPYGN